MPDPTEQRGRNVDPGQLEHFGAHSDWADAHGSWRALHDINPARCQFIERSITQMLHLQGLGGLAILDVGCGGGILSASLASLGAKVTGIDAQDSALEAARQYARSKELQIDFRLESADEHHPGQAYDAVVCCELLEHVPDYEQLIQDCARLTRPGGAVVFSTLTRTPASFVGAILGAEYLLGIVPKGTHRYTDFIRPNELRRSASQRGLSMVGLSGLDYNPWTRQARLSPKIRINYLAAFRRNQCPSGLEPTSLG